MATVPIVPGKTAAQLTARTRANLVLPQVLSAPGGLFPMRSAAFEVDEYRILSGWPVPVPDGDIRIDCLVSAEGDVIIDRDPPTGLITNADMRWVADTNYYDQISLRWAPIQGNCSPWSASPTNAPTLFTDYEYRIGDERFVGMTALNFDSNTNDYLANNLDLAMGGTSGYTVIMVLSPNSLYGNDLAVPENALWGPDDSTGSYVSFTVREQAVYMSTETLPGQLGVPIGDALNSTAPSYLALVVSRPLSTLYAAPGPGKVLSKGLTAGEVPEPLSTRFWLGNSPFPTTATADMALFDLGIYGNPLTRAEVVAEFTALSAVYGGDG